MYEGKARYAQRKAADNAEKAAYAGLTDEQIEALEELTAFRHWLHCNSESAANAESPEAPRINKECSEYYDDGIREKVKALFIVAPFERCDWDSSEYWSTFDDDEKRDFLKEEGSDLEPDDDDAYLVWWDHCVTDAVRTLEKVNDQIESFLKMIDERYGTNYCPTGRSRLY